MEKKRISNIVWALVIGALIVADIIQIILNLAYGAGVLINRFITIVVMFFFGFWLQLNGQSFTSGKRAITFLSSFVLEEIPGSDFIPWLTIEGLYNRHLERKGEKAEKKTEEQEAVPTNLSGRREGNSRTSDVAEPPNVIQGNFSSPSGMGQDIRPPQEGQANRSNIIRPNSFKSASSRGNDKASYKKAA